jgi:hypothetical protein
MKKLIVLLALPLIAEEAKKLEVKPVTDAEKLAISQAQTRILSLNLQVLDEQQKLRDLVSKVEQDHGCKLGQDLNCVKPEAKK